MPHAVRLAELGGGGDLYYLGQEDEGWVHTGWQSLAADDDAAGAYDVEEWFYFRPSSGKAVRDIRKKLKDRYYTFDENGVMQDKWEIGDPDLDWESNSQETEEGSSRNVGWVYSYAPDDEDESGDRYWFYLDSKGIPFNAHGRNSAGYWGYAIEITSRRVDPGDPKTNVAARVIQNKTYLFDEEGKMLTGLYYLISVNRVGGPKLGSNAQIYYFQPKEGPTEGQMVTGKQNVELDDTCHFYFRDDGIAYTSIIVDGRLYAPDGIRMDADKGSEYALYHFGSNFPVTERGNKRKHINCTMIVDEKGRVKKSGVIKFGGVRYTIKNYEIVAEEDID